MIADLLSDRSINLNMSANSKAEAIQELVDLLVSANEGLDRKELMESAVEREERMSTGLGKGVAVVRSRSEGVDKILCAIGVKRGGIDFDALDGLPVEIFLMIAAPRKTNDTYVSLLGCLYRMLNQETFRSNLLKAGSPKEVLTLVSEEEKELED